MQVSVTFRNLESKEAVREYVMEKISKLKKFLETPIEANVVLSSEKHNQIAEITLSGNRVTLNAKDENEEILAAIDRAVEKLERQILKHKEKGRQHKFNTSAGELLRNPNSAFSEMAEDSADRKIMKTQTLRVPSISVEEAASQLENSNYQFYIFQNSISKDLNVLYRMKDGHYGLIIPRVG